MHCAFRFCFYLWKLNCKQFLWQISLKWSFSDAQFQLLSSNWSWKPSNAGKQTSIFSRLKNSSNHQLENQTMQAIFPSKKTCKSLTWNARTLFPSLPFKQKNRYRHINNQHYLVQNISIQDMERWKIVPWELFLKQTKNHFQRSLRIDWVYVEGERAGIRHLVMSFLCPIYEYDIIYRHINT